MQNKNKFYTTLIQSDVYCENTNKTADSIIIIGQNIQQIKETFTIYFNKQLDQTFQDLLGKLKEEGSSKQTSQIIAEIEAIRKQLILNTSN